MPSLYLGELAHRFLGDAPELSLELSINGDTLECPIVSENESGNEECGGGEQRLHSTMISATAVTRSRDDPATLFRMKSHTRHLTLNVPARMDFVNITAEVEAELRSSGIREGLCLVNAMHITASVFINDDERGLHEDYKRWLEWLAPYDPSPERYHHNRTGEDNGDAHHKRQVMGREVVVAVTDGKLDFGPWEQIFYGEFDGRRPKRILVKIIGE